MLQIQQPSVRPLTTAHLAQTMTLLALPNVELRERVLEELSNNPALELLEERICPNCQRRLHQPGPCPRCSLQKQPGEPIVFLSPRDSYRAPRALPLDDPPPEREPAAPEDLPAYALQQLAADLDERKRRLAAYILACLDDDGFLADPPPFIARATRCTLAEVDEVLDLIARGDPPGLATQGPRQALLVQLDMLEGSDPRVSLARRMLEETFAELGKREFEAIARTLGASVREVRATAAFIQENLNPYPARAYWGSGLQSPGSDPHVYHTPDIQISKQGNNGTGPLTVEIFTPLSGWLRVNPLFRQALSAASGEHSEAWAQHLERASLFIKCMQQRNNTMRRLMRLLVKEQREFILMGDRHLKPMTRAWVAQQLGVHESTISRAVSHKSVALPDGRIIPLARFFDRSLSVRDRIREIVSKETAPLTDDQIAHILAEDGIRIARRTVAKYRAMEGILPARLRHKQKQPEGMSN